MWVMTTVESREYLWRVDELLKVPAAVRGLSLEPLLGPVDLENFPLKTLDAGENPGINFVLAGGESGPKARPAHPDWFRAVRDACQAAGVPFFFKQHGEWLPESQFGADGDKPTPGNTGAQWGIIDWSGHFFPWTTAWNGKTGEDSDTGETYVYRVGKKAAGRLLDGREWNEMPRQHEAPEKAA